MARFKHTDKWQGMFLAINLADQIQQGTFEWALNQIIDQMDLSLFEAKYNNDEKGAPAYQPRLLLKAIMFCYSRGIISSRKIEKTCKENIISKALAEDSEPDHDTIATFISSNSEAVADLFAQVLFKCSELKLVTGEMFAIDGCKLPSNASKECSGKIDELNKKREKLEKYIKRVIKQHRELDKDEEAAKKQEAYAKTMGTRKERKARQLKRLNKKLRKLDEFLATAKPKKGVANGEVKSNITDNESGFIKGPNGYIQGYNGVAIADSGNQIIASAEVTGSGPESGTLPEMLGRLEGNMREATGEENPLEEALVIGDTGFFSEGNLQEAKKRGVEVLIPDPQFRKRDPHFDGRKGHAAGKKRFTVEDFEYNPKEDIYKCPAGYLLGYKGHVELRNNRGRKYQVKRGHCANCPLLKKCVNVKTSKNPARTLYVTDNENEENLSEKMRKRIDDPAYRELYSRRQQIVEPVFSDITYCKGMDRFTLRGKEKVGVQWKYYCMVHNIGKCIKALLERLGA